MYTVYMLQTSSNTFYTGQTKNLAKRILQHTHKGKSAAKYMKYFTSFELVYTESKKTLSEALKREAALKRLTRKEKELLVLGFAARM